MPGSKHLGDDAWGPYPWAMRPQVKRALRWAAGILGVIVLLGVVMGATLAAQFAGGWGLLLLLLVISIVLMVIKKSKKDKAGEV